MTIPSKMIAPLAMSKDFKSRLEKAEREAREIARSKPKGIASASVRRLSAKIKAKAPVIDTDAVYAARNRGAR